MKRSLFAALAAMLCLVPAAAAWTKPLSTGGQFVGEPSLVNQGTIGKKSYVLVGRGSNNAMWFTISADGKSWAKWTSLGGEITSAPTCVSRTPYIVDCWARGSNNMLWQRSMVNGEWRDWYQVNDYEEIANQPFAVASNDDTIEVFAGSYGSLFVYNWSGSWTPQIGTGISFPISSRGACGAIPSAINTLIGDPDKYVTLTDRTLMCVFRDNNTSFRVWGYSMAAQKELNGPFQGMEPTKYAPSIYIQKQKQGEIATITVTGLDGRILQGKYLVGSGWTESFQFVGETFVSAPSCVPGLCAGLGQDNAVWVVNSK